ncbi:MAG: hypothetical protein R6U96_18030 [Promethearchaeia archaeon]
MGLFSRDKEKEKEEDIMYEEFEEEGEAGTSGEEPSMEGLLAQINLNENLTVTQDHDMNVDSSKFNGKFEIKNPSTKDRIWDLDINLKNIEQTNLEESEIYVRELGVTEGENTDRREYQISGDIENKLLAKEFISTLPEAYENWDIKELEKIMLQEAEEEEELEAEEEEELEAEEEEIGEEYEEDMDEDSFEEESKELPVESFGIAINKVNNVVFLIALRNQFEGTIKDIELVKELPSEFENLVILESTLGSSEREDHNIIWNIDELEPNRTVYLKFSADIQVETKETVKTGSIDINYETRSSLTEGLSIEKFEAYTRNRFTIDQIERDEEPGVWDCNLAFENPSEFLVELYDVDVHETDEPDKKLVEIESESPIQVARGEEWLSPDFQIESEEYPHLQKEINFRVGYALNKELKGEIAVGEVDLVLASIFGELIYGIPEEEEEVKEEEIEEEEKPILVVPTYQDSTIDSTLKVENDGSAPLNEISWQQRYFTDEFLPPSDDEIVCLKDGEEISIDPEQVTYEDNILRINFDNLKDSDMGMFDPDSELEFNYPIHVNNPSKDAIFDSEVIIKGNTYPRSKELEYIPEPETTPAIKAVHTRRKYRVGKEIIPVGSFGEYEIILEVVNKGNMPLEDIFVRDKVADHFERLEFSMEPEIIDLDGVDILKWQIDEIDVDSSVVSMTRPCR